MNRLKEDLIELNKFGMKFPKRIEKSEQLSQENSITRFTGSDADKKARDYVVKLMEELGLEVKVDKVGNIFGRLKGTVKSTVMTGSHIDTVVNGGMFDGVFGVLGAIEAVRRIINDGFENERSIEVVVFSGEEGSSFPVGLLGSSFLTGKKSVEELYALKNSSGETLEEVLEKMGYKGDFVRHLDDVEYFLEMHIEQGPVLFEEGIPIGIVENITGISWILATIAGKEGHAGTTPMKMRRDALVAASEVVSFVYQRASEMAQESTQPVATVGRLNVFPNGPNIIPREVQMTVDVRDVVKEKLESLINETLKTFEGLKERYGVEVHTEVPFIYEPVPMSKEVIDTIERSSEQLKIPARRMNSGAGHDAQNMAEKVKTGMIFVPSVNGVSHSPLEWTEWEDLEKGVKVLTQCIKNLSVK
ncbi:Zn-dependent hydrolase [Archaeoglobales archaeon]|nr:MAG: Zn-dependent hydrolase [Archaeoglobales archaeon]